MSSDYESVRLSDDDKEFFEQIEVRNGRNEIKEYRSFGERFSTLFTNIFYCSCFDDDEFIEYKTVKTSNKRHSDQQHIRLLTKTPHKKRSSSNNNRANDDIEEPIALPPPDSTRELSSDDSEADDNNNEIISLPVQTIKPKTPPVSSSSSSSSSSEERSFKKSSPPPLFSIDEEHSDDDDNTDMIEEDQKTSVCITSINPSLVPKTITFIAERKKEIMSIKNEYTKAHNRFLSSKNTEQAKTLEKKIALILDLITWCSRLIDNMNTFLKELSVYKNRNDVFITYNISEYCSEVRSYFEDKTYTKFLRQDEGFEDLAIIRHLPVIYIK